MKKKLVVINGTMGSGKTTICRELYTKLENSVWLDGDWCWMMHPWNFTEQNKTMVIQNVHFLLKAYLSNSSSEYAVFSWIIHREKIFDEILAGMTGLEFAPFKFMLTCSELELIRGLKEDKRSEEQIRDSVGRLRLYDELDTVKIDTTDSSVANTVETIVKAVTVPASNATTEPLENTCDRDFGHS